MAEYVVMPKADYEVACNSIRAKTGKTDLIKSGSLSTEIDSITGSGGSSADVRYVTFTNPATGETFVKPVIKGDDCVDVVAKGLWATPTQESTAQYDYAFANSWSAEPNGSADANILKNITEDKTVYAVFTATARLYTITWLDDDGVTELPGQKQWAYGSVPSYAPTKDGVAFAGWTPTPVAVTGDATYTATWTTLLTLASSQSVTTTLDASASPDSPNTTIQNEPGVAFAIGDTLIVTWDGVAHEYEVQLCTFVAGTVTIHLRFVGNPYAFTKNRGDTISSRKINNQNAIDTGEEFMIALNDLAPSIKRIAVYTKTAGTHTVEVLKVP